jgi:hypothetical protein
MSAIKDSALLLAITAGMVLLFLLPVCRHSLDAGFPLDDGWIHATYARNLAANGEFAFNPGEASTGTTSLLWTAVVASTLSVASWILPGNQTFVTDPQLAVWTPLMLGACSLLLLVYFWHRLLLRSGFPRMQALLATIILPLSGILPWWTLSGMETVPFLLFATLAVLGCIRDRPLYCGIFLALLLLTRPEGLLLAPVLAWVAWRRATARHALIVLLPVILGLAIYLLWNLAVGGTLWTSTFAGRQWLAVGGRDVSFGIAEYPSAWLQLHLRWFHLLLAGMLRQAAIGTWVALALALLLLLRHGGFVLVKWKKRRSAARAGRHAHETDASLRPGRQSAARNTGKHTGSGWRQEWTVPAVLIVWSLLHGAAYALLLPYPGHAGRYLAPLLLPAAFLFAKFAVQPLFPHPHRPGYSTPDTENTTDEYTTGEYATGEYATGEYTTGASHGGSVSRQAGRNACCRILPLLHRRILPPAMLLAAMLLVGSAAVENWRMAWKSSVEHINTVHRRAASWFADNTPPGSSVAAFDIGALGFFSDRTIIDLGGLLDGDVLPFMRGRIDEYILASNADYVAMIFPYEGLDAAGFLPAALGYGSGALHTRQRMVFCYPPSLYDRHITITGNAYPCIRIDQIVSDK